MSLNTLLEAAKFLELQEQESHHNADETGDAMTLKPNLTQQDALSQAAPPSSVKAVLITSTAHHGDFAISAANSGTSNILAIAASAIKKEIEAPSLNNGVATPRRILHNSFDIINPLVIDEATGTEKRRQPPMVFRAGTREVHNKLEKHRRAHLKECFDVLKKQLPATQDEKKTSNLSILHSALRCIQALKRRERELEHEMERLARDKIAAQQRLAVLKKDISIHYENVDFNKILPESVPTVLHADNGDSMMAGGGDGERAGHVLTVGTGGGNGISREQTIKIPILATAGKHQQIAIASTTQTPTTQVAQQSVQTTAVSVLPVGYPVSQGLVLQKLAIVPKGLTDLTPLVSTHFIAQQQINGKVVPLVNAQYVVKPVVVVSRPS